jgi:peptidoglycan/xylan/chitin deacetylase (PgdA/CDA1 family)
MIADPNTLTIVMYHHIGVSTYNGFCLHSLSKERFLKQLDYFEDSYKIADYWDINRFISGESRPVRPLLALSFDDGYEEHYSIAFKELASRKITGFFFPVARVLNENTPLDANLIHLLLGGPLKGSELVRLMEESARNEGVSESLLEHLRDRFYKPFYYSDDKSVFDDADVVYVKRCLQRGFHGNVRRKVLHQLVSQVLSEDLVRFLPRFYLDKIQLQDMIEEGMVIGSHGYDHFWLGDLSLGDQLADLAMSKAFLEEMHTEGAFTKRVLCYPYGSYNSDTISIAKSLGFEFAFGTNPGWNLPSEESRYSLARLNANDFPL